MFCRVILEDVRDSHVPSLVDEEEFRRNVELLKKRTASPRMGGRKASKAKSPIGSPVIGSEASSPKRNKEGRKWDGKISAKDAKSLDYSNSDGNEFVKPDHLVTQSGLQSTDNNNTDK